MNRSPSFNFNTIVVKIFRRLRYYFLEESKFRKYALYAIGEVLLIVFGILIALQLNNLKEEKVNRDRERIYLEEYLKDLKYCKNDLRRTIDRSGSFSINSDSLLQIIHNRDPDLDPNDNIRIIMNSYGWSTFEGSEGTVTEILNGGNLHLIRNQHIRSSIASWQANLKDMKSWEVVLREFVEDYYSFLIDYMDIDTLEKPENMFSGRYRDTMAIKYTETITQKELVKLYSQKRFKNIVFNITWRQKLQNIKYRQKQREIDSLIGIVELELKRFD